MLKLNEMMTQPPKEILFSYKLYNCEYCSFHTNNKKDYEKHLLTNKHYKAYHVAMCECCSTTQPQPQPQAQAQPQPQAQQQKQQQQSQVQTIVDVVDHNEDDDAPPTFTIPLTGSGGIGIKQSATTVARKREESASIAMSTQMQLVATGNMSMTTNGGDQPQQYLCLCGRKYKNAYGLKYHKKKCAIITPEIVMNMVHDNQELRNIIVAQNKLMMEHTHAFQQHLTDLIPKLGGAQVANTTTNTTINHNHHNTQNTFNLNIFLNEKCKDAWNMSDFINSLQVTLDDLLVTRERGIGESIGRILVQGLSTLDVYKRPIHCTDLKRDTMYVKDKEVWERDEQNAKIKSAIDQLSYKQIITVDDWKQSQPDIANNDDLQLKYNTILLKVLTDPDEKDARKIIKSIGKETSLDKESHLLRIS
jgi:hypothetical protein